MRSRSASPAARKEPWNVFERYLVLLGDRVLPQGDPQLPDASLGFSRFDLCTRAHVFRILGSAVDIRRVRKGRRFHRP